jgi:hypothetical protein
MGKKLGILAAIFGIILAVGIIVWKIPKPKNEPQEFPSEYTEEETIKYKVPESPVSHVMEAEGKERDTLYSDTTICSTFAEDIRDMCIEVFGDYLRPLQEPYELITEAGYEYFVAYGSDAETCVKVSGESLEFNVYLPGARGRVVIEKSGDTYSSTFRILEDGEHETTPVIEEGDFEEVESVGVVHYGFNQNNPQPVVPGYVSMNESYGLVDYVLFDGDEIADTFESIIDKVREVWGTDDALCDLLNYKYEISGDTALGIFKISEDGTHITYGDYLFVLSNNENGIATDVYKKK